MAGSSLTNVDAALKNIYLPGAREQLNDSFLILAQVSKNTEDIEGRYAVLSLHGQRNSGVGARAEGAVLPTAGYQGFSEERILVKHNYATIRVTGPQIRAMKSDKGSYVRPVSYEMKRAVFDLKRDVNRQIFGTSDSVIVALGTTSSSTTVVLAATASVTQIRQLEVGMLIDIGTSAPYTQTATARRIVSVNASAKTLVISGAAISTGSTDRIVRAGSGAAASEITGLQSIVAASGTLFNVNPSTDAFWASPVYGNSGTLRACTETLLAYAVMEGGIVSGTEIDAFVTTSGVHRNYAAQMLAQKRFNDTVDLKGGFSGLSITAGSGKKALTWDRDCPNNSAFGLNWDHLTEYVQSDWDWSDVDGSILRRATDGTDAFEAFMYKDHELATDHRSAHLLVSDLSES